MKEKIVKLLIASVTMVILLAGAAAAASVGTAIQKNTIKDAEIGQGAGKGGLWGATAGDGGTQNVNSVVVSGSGRVDFVSQENSVSGGSISKAGKGEQNVNAVVVK